MDEKRMVGDYTVINSMYIGHREIILGENPKAASGEKYVCCYAERVLFYEQYLEAQVSDDFAEIVKLYGERVTQAADEIMKETEKVTSEIGMNDEITAKDCKLFMLDGRNIRRKISALRQDGFPICSDETGYYYADNQKEINHTVCRLNELVTKVSNARTGLLFASVLGEKEQTIEVTIKVK